MIVKMIQDFGKRMEKMQEILTKDLELKNKLTEMKNTLSSVHFSSSVMSDSLRPHESQHARPPSPSPTPGVHSD